MAEYPTDFPALPLLGNPHDRAMVSSMAAPSIAAGTLHQDAHLHQAMQEYKQRQQLQTMGLATETEVVTARERVHALETEFALAAYPPHPQREQILATRHAMCVLHQALATRAPILASMRKDLKATCRAMAAADNVTKAACQDMKAIQTDLRAIRHIHDRTNTLRHNDSQRAENRVRVDMVSTHGDFPLATFVKVSAQGGSGIIPRHARRPGLPVVDAGADIPSPPFPTTRDAIQRMTKQDINDLAIVMDDHFGILPTDSTIVAAQAAYVLDRQSVRVTTSLADDRRCRGRRRACFR